MADTDEASNALRVRPKARCRRSRRTWIHWGRFSASCAIRPNATLLEEFGRQFAEYRTLSQSILGLAVENTNLKAQRLSFGAAQQSADAFRDALDR